MSQYHSLVIILIFSKQFLRPRQSGAHGTCHACHTLDTPLEIHERPVQHYFEVFGLGGEGQSFVIVVDL